MTLCVPASTLREESGELSEHTPHSEPPSFYCVYIHLVVRCGVRMWAARVAAAAVVVPFSFFPRCNMRGHGTDTQSGGFSTCNNKTDIHMICPCVDFTLQWDPRTHFKWQAAEQIRRRQRQLLAGRGRVVEICDNIQAFAELTALFTGT